MPDVFEAAQGGNKVTSPPPTTAGDASGACNGNALVIVHSKTHTVSFYSPEDYNFGMLDVFVPGPGGNKVNPPSPLMMPQGGTGGG